MRISDWSSDVCSSDLIQHREMRVEAGRQDQDAVVARLLLDDLHQPLQLRAVIIELLVERPAMQALLIKDQDHQRGGEQPRSEEHTSELQSLMRISYTVFCLKKKLK